MNTRLSIFIFLFISNFIYCYSQNKIYIDENMQSISSGEYTKKCDRQAYKCLKYQTDSIEMYKVLYKFNFGTIDVEEYKQIQKLLEGNTLTDKNNNQVLVIKYIKIIDDFETLEKNYLNHVKTHDSIQALDGGEKIIHKNFNLKTYNRDIKNRVKTSNKCVKKFEKKLPVDICYIYRTEQKSLDKYQGMNLIKDRGILKNKFFKITDQYNLLIIKPDGEYLLSGSHISDKDVMKLIKNKDWSSYKSDWQATIDTHIIDGIGMFERYNYYYHKDHCF